MKDATRRIGLAVAVLTLMAGAAGQARADILLDLEDPIGQTNTAFALPFIAGAATTTIEIAGYQLPSFSHVTNINLSLTSGGPNLLGSTWTFTPATSGSDTSTFNDGTSVPALSFGGVSEDNFDRYAQTISTVVGQSYTLRFLFTNPGAPANAPSELRVSATDTLPNSVPEPATLIGAGIAGLMGLGYAWRRRRVEFAA